MVRFWDSVTLPQATVVSGLLTIVAAIIGVFIGWLLFSGRVKDLTKAVEASEDLLKDHQIKVETSINDVYKIVQGLSKSIVGLDEQFKTTLESLGQLRGNVGDIQENISDRENLSESNTSDLSYENLRELWASIRESLEEIVANTKDGRTRAKYVRIDRRNYLDLIKALQADNALGANASHYQEAAELWQKYRNRRSFPDSHDTKTISELKQKLTGSK